MVKRIHGHTFEVFQSGLNLFDIILREVHHVVIRVLEVRAGPDPWCLQLRGPAGRNGGWSVVAVVL